MNIMRCCSLQSLHKLPPHLESLTVRDCTSLQDFPDLPELRDLKHLDIYCNGSNLEVSLEENHLQICFRTWPSPLKTLHSRVPTSILISVSLRLYNERHVHLCLAAPPPPVHRVRHSPSFLIRAILHLLPLPPEATNSYLYMVTSVLIFTGKVYDREVRSGALRQPLILLPGQEFTFTIRRGVGTTDCVSVNYDDFANDVDAGDMLLVDGFKSHDPNSTFVTILWYDALVVKCKDEDLVKCEVVDGSELKSRRHLNVRGESATLQSITEKDWDNIKFGMDNKIDFYAVSFVKDAEVAMVARGDLGVELPGDEVPSLQYGKSFYSGNKYVRNHDCSSTPKRAEVLIDIAIAVKEGSDAVIPSGETAHGKVSHFV
ncbi:hypothetical protein DCAR_0935311 [Daucus carota subsp. sativus]|uniref:pyruvate kinase n=1 Tax=Daucus carota subsp. sativus TaxID=79200 RepID=A0A175YH37_DAUCS|nr:hypothetical protein DCAR_0935311 [Daucus carota subsp. sativus]